MLLQSKRERGAGPAGMTHPPHSLISGKRGSWWYLPCRVTGGPHSNACKTLSTRCPGHQLFQPPLPHVHFVSLSINRHSLSDSNSVESVVGLLQATSAPPLLLSVQWNKSPSLPFQGVGCEVTGTPVIPTVIRPGICLGLSRPVTQCIHLIFTSGREVPLSPPF